MPAKNRDSYPALGGLKLSDQVTAELENRILSGEFDAEERLPTEAELCELFGVSRSVIRDATRTLTARGLISVHRGRGIIVTKPTSRAFEEALVLLLSRSAVSMGDVTSARAAIETHLAPLAAQAGTEDDWDAMDRHITAFESALRVEDWETVSDEHLSFHLALLRAIRLPALEVLLRPMHEVFLVSSLPPLDSRELWDTPLDAHRPIVDALRRRDPEEARKALEYHFSFLKDERYREFEATPFREIAVGFGQRRISEITGARQAEDGDEVDPVGLESRQIGTPRGAISK